MTVIRTKSGTEIETNEVYTFQVYTTAGHFTLLVGSEAECRLLARLLKKHSVVYKLKMIAPSGRSEYLYI
jgi:hypothetical protein